MSTTADAVNGARPDHDHNPGEVTVDLHLVENNRWCALDLDELLEQLVLAGRPPELICTYTDPSGRRRYVRRHIRRNRREIAA